jgi:hypothetical protein
VLGTAWPAGQSSLPREPRHRRLAAVPLPTDRRTYDRDHPRPQPVGNTLGRHVRHRVELDLRVRLLEQARVADAAGIVPVPLEVLD